MASVAPGMSLTPIQEATMELRALQTVKVRGKYRVPGQKSEVWDEEDEALCDHLIESGLAEEYSDPNIIDFPLGTSDDDDPNQDDDSDQDDDSGDSDSSGSLIPGLEEE